jgi:type VI secretion system protein ImpJ
LAVPLLREGRKNASRQPADGTRFLLDTLEMPDENEGGNPQAVDVRLLNLRLLLSTQDQSGYEVLPIARITKSARAEAPPELDKTYIPPLLACDAWKVLAHEILQSIYDRIGSKLDTLAKLIVSQKITFDSMAQGAPLTFAQLRILNEAYAVLGIQCFAQGVHPLVSYVELCRIVGQLAIIDDSRRVPNLPKYNHDDLGECFYAAKKYIDALLDKVEKPVYEEVPFVGAGLRMQVALRSNWLETNWQMFIGVQTPLSVEECIKMLTKQGLLDMKIGSSDHVDEIFRLGERGLIFTHTARPPNALPVTKGLVYFQVNRESQQAEWQRVYKSLAVAIRLNENLIVGNIQGQRKLTIKAGGQTTTMEFTLYLLPKDVK